MIHPLWGESEFRGGHGACHGELSAEGEKFLREHLHPDYFFDQNGSFLRKMSVWKPSPPIYITHQEPEYHQKNQIFSKIASVPREIDKKNQIFSKIPRNRSQNGSFLRKICHPDYFFDQNGSFLRKMSVWKPSPSIYITYQEPEYDQKNQIFSKIS